jgi:hypothetical protein
MIIKALASAEEDPEFAHDFFFHAKHDCPTPEFHGQLISEFHDEHPQRLTLSFRGSGKSTILEEGVIVDALFQRFHNCLILSSSEQRSCDRLRRIKNELTYNETILGTCDVQQGPVWSDSRIVLANGVCIQAIGAGQSLRGIKHLTWRPDLLIVDDVEGDRDASTPHMRQQARDWLTGTLIPALEAKRKIRIFGTPMDAESLLVTLSRVPSWATTTIPIKAPDLETGAWVPAWEAKYPLPWIDDREAEFRAMGNLTAFYQELMVQAVTESERTFKAEHLRFEPTQRRGQPVYLA